MADTKILIETFVLLSKNFNLIDAAGITYRNNIVRSLRSEQSVFLGNQGRLREELVFESALDYWDILVESSISWITLHR